jgi:hypothetical protein
MGAQTHLYPWVPAAQAATVLQVPLVTFQSEAALRKDSASRLRPRTFPSAGPWSFCAGAAALRPTPGAATRRDTDRLPRWALDRAPRMRDQAPPIQAPVSGPAALAAHARRGQAATFRSEAATLRESASRIPLRAELPAAPRSPSVAAEAQWSRADVDSRPATRPGRRRGQASARRTPVWEFSRQGRGTL